MSSPVEQSYVKVSALEVQRLAANAIQYFENWRKDLYEEEIQKFVTYTSFTWSWSKFRIIKTAHTRNREQAIIALNKWHDKETENSFGLCLTKHWETMGGTWYSLAKKLLKAASHTKDPDMFLTINDFDFLLQHKKD